MRINDSGDQALPRVLDPSYVAELFRVISFPDIAPLARAAAGSSTMPTRRAPPLLPRRGLLEGAALAGAAALTPTAAIPQADRSPAPMPAPMTAEEVRALLGLEPHPTCGFVRLTFLSRQAIAPGGLPPPFAEGRPLGSALYFMVTPERAVRLHRIRNDQLYHYYLGDPLEVLMLHGDGTSERSVVGPDLRNGQRVQLFIPGGTFHTARLVGDRRWFLGASTEWPGVEPADVEIGNLDDLTARYPREAVDLRAFAAAAGPG